MTLEAVVADIREQVEETVAEIQADADEQADSIIAAAEADAEETIAQAKADVERRIEREREQQLSSATLEAKQERLAARRDLLEAVHDRVRETLANIEGERREELTRSLLSAGLEQFDDGEVRVYGRASDDALLEEIIADHDDVGYAGEYECLGGVVLESDQARVRVNNTFDSVLEEVWEDRLKDVSDRLFEQ